MSETIRFGRWAVASLACGILAVPVAVLTMLTAFYPGLLLLLVLVKLALVFSRKVLDDISRIPRRSRAGWTLAAVGGITCAMGALFLVPATPSICMVREAALRVQAGNNFHQIALAMHAYHEKHGRLPPAVVCNQHGEPLYSWRVLLLPFLEQENLYQEFHLDEPWDSPHNVTLLPRMPKVYAPAYPVVSDRSLTFCQVFTGPGTPFEIKEGPRLTQDFPDGTSNTLLIAEAAEPVPWTKPADLVYDPDGPLPGLGGVFKGGGPLSGAPRTVGFTVARADGSVRFVSRNLTSEATIRSAITRNGSEALGNDW
jgi:Protein of unknown function (DUF1559)